METIDCNKYIYIHILDAGLFKRAILQSGSALSPWAIQEDPELQARKFGQLAGYQGQDLHGLVEHLKSQPSEKLCELVCSSFVDAMRVRKSPNTFRK